MKKPIIFCMLLCTVFFSHAQILRKIADKAKQKVEQKTNEKVEETTQGNKNDKSGNDENQKTDTENQATHSTSDVGIKAYSKYDFVPGEKIMVFEDFTQDEIGDFPQNWNTNSSAEIVTIETLDGKWLQINRQGVFMPDFINDLPENFTLEYDLFCDNPGKVWALYTTVATLADRNRPESWQMADSRFTFTVASYPDGNSTSALERRKDGAAEPSRSTGTKQFSDKTKPVHVAMWRQKERMRVYFNQEKVWDLPKVMSQTGVYNSLVFWMQGPSDDGNFYLSNLRLAVGIPNTRKKILEQDRWVTHGILFDVNKATIKPESYGTLKEMASVLKDYPDLKVNIVGHTDSDGKDDSNLDLSKRRATAVKEMLAKEFGIDESRMQTDGKGESEPIDTNDNLVGKANNRRVEFIKI